MKFDSTGVEQWRTQSGSSGEEYGRSIVVDRNGSTFVLGETGGDFGGAPADDTQFHQYLAKYNLSGELLWAKDLGLGRATALNIDNNNNVIVTRSSSSVALYDNNGQLLWSDLINCASTKCNAIAVDNMDNI